MRLALFDLLGRTVQTLFDGTVEGGTTTSLTLDASRPGSGTYIVRLEAHETNLTERVLILK